nr:small ubiquitin-related modifier 1-like [Tanacetum cinerariifolium]
MSEACRRAYAIDDEIWIERSTQLKKLISAYCDRKSIEINSIAFLFDGRHLRGEHTPDELKPLGIGFPHMDRKCLFNIINDLPTVFDVVALSSKKEPAEKSAVSNQYSQQH